MAKALFWWLLTCLQGTGLVVAYQNGYLTALIDGDPSRISIIMLIMHGIIWVLLGVRTLRSNRLHLEPFWYSAEVQLSLGMIGTLIGFIVIFTQIFTTIDHSNTEAIKQAISTLATGIGTATWTTLVGLISATLIKAILVDLERVHS